MRIAIVAPVAQPIPPPRSGSIETMTALLTEGLVSLGHEVTLFATGTSTTRARLHAIFPRGYAEDDSLWPWEICEAFNVASAIEQADAFDVIHCQAQYAPFGLACSRLSRTPVVHTVHHAPLPPEVAIWARYREVPFIAVSSTQAGLLTGLNVVATIHHAVDLDAFYLGSTPDDYLLFLGRFTAGKGVLQAIDVARRSGMRLILAAKENDYYRGVVAQHVDHRQIVYAGEVDHPAKVALLAGARALLYPVQEPEPFGLVLTEAFACGTPVAALDRGAVREIVDENVTGGVFEFVAGLPRVMALDRAGIRTRAEARFGVDRMVNAHLNVYSLVAACRAV
jgi:glycosyltransferase involved in cell wall biosynthesis